MPGQQKLFCSLYCHIKHRNHTADSKSQMMEGLSSQGPVPTKALPNCPLPQEENLTPFETRVHRGWKPVTVEPNSCLIHIGIPAGCVTGGVYCTVGDELSRVLLLLSPPLLSSPLPGLTQCLRAFSAVVLWLFEPWSLIGLVTLITLFILCCLSSSFPPALSVTSYAHFPSSHPNGRASDRQPVGRTLESDAFGLV